MRQGAGHRLWLPGVARRSTSSARWVQPRGPVRAREGTRGGWLKICVLAWYALTPAAAEARRCATLAAFAERSEPSPRRGHRLDAARRRPTLQPRSQPQGNDRPASHHHLDSERHPLRVHAPGPGWSARQQRVLEILEEAWESQVIRQGYPPPLADAGAGGSDALDIYLGATAPAAAITVAEPDADANDGRHAASAYLVVDGTLEESELAPVLHHEFAHALQFGIDLSESLMFFEASAMAQEFFWDRENGFESLSWAADLPAYQRYMNASPYANGIDLIDLLGEDTLYEYGAVLFLLFLEQEFGSGDGVFLRSLWQASIQPDQVQENEPDWLDALDGEIDSRAAILSFANWRHFLASQAAFGDGVEGGEYLGGDALPRVLRLLPSALSGQALQLSGARQLQPLGCASFSVEAPAHAPLPLEVRVSREGVGEGLPAGAEAIRPWGVAWWVREASGEVEWTEVRDERWNLGRIPLSLRPGALAVVSVCDLGEADADGIQPVVPMTLRVGTSDLPGCAWSAAGCGSTGGRSDEVEPRDGGDAGLIGERETHGGCTCQGAPSGAGRGHSWKGLAMTGAGIVIFLLRYLRLRKRKRLYRASRRR